jgi:2-ketoarginine methyltransferase
MTLEQRLVDALQPIRQYVVATAIHHLFESGIYDRLLETESDDAALAARFDFEPERLAALLQFLCNEGYLVRNASNAVRLSDRGRALREFRGWYTMLIGGYGGTFLSLGDALKRGSDSAGRRADLVGIGSCAISHYDAIPLTRRLMAQIPSGARRILDLGCGNARYLVEFCKLLPSIEAWGVEPDRAGYEAAAALVAQEGLTDRIHLTCAGAVEFFAQDLAFVPDLTVLGFVLHELLGQQGEAGVVAFLEQLVARYPDIHLIVIEVDAKMADPASMRHPLALAYYNGYFLFHPFTRQRLESIGFWEQLFERAGLELLARDTTDADVDSTGFEVGFLLRRATRR